MAGAGILTCIIDFFSVFQLHTLLQNYWCIVISAFFAALSAFNPGIKTTVNELPNELMEKVVSEPDCRQAHNAFDVFDVNKKCWRNGYDLPLDLQQSLSAAPPCLFLLLALFRIRALWKSGTKTSFTHWGIPMDYLLLWKALAITALLAVQLGLILVWSLSFPNDKPAPFSIPAAVLRFVAVVILYPLSYLEHTRSFRTSNLIACFLLATLLLGIMQARTLYQLDLLARAGLLSASIAAKLALFILETKDKRLLLKPPYNEYSLETTGGILKRSFLWWLNSLFLKGRKGRLAPGDLYDIDPSLSAELLRDKMQLWWDRRSRPEGEYTLLLQTAGCLSGPILWTIPPKVFFICFTYAQPLLFRCIMDFIGAADTTEDDTLQRGLFLIMGTAFLYLGLAISQVLYKCQVTRTITMLRGSLIGIIFNKSLMLDNTRTSDSEALTLISTDVDRIVASMSSANELWAGMIGMTLGVFLLWFTLKTPRGIVPIIVCIGVFSIGSIQSSIPMYRYQKIWSAAIQKRNDITSEVLENMTGLRMMGFGGIVTKTIERLRQIEIVNSRRYRRYNTLTGFFSNFPHYFGVIITFVVYEKWLGETLDTNKAFTTLTIISLITNPTITLLSAIPNTFTCLGNFERIQQFLLSPSWVDDRTKLKGVENSVSTETTTSSDQMEFVLNATPPEKDVHVTDLTVRISPESPEAAISHVSLKLRRATINFMVGPTGSGKSTLMRAILGELPFDGGSIRISDTGMAYCSQTPWLPTSRIWKIICGIQDPLLIDRSLYTEAKYACALDQEIENLAEGDETLIGNGGVMLNGGQMQRLAIARAIYSKKRIVLLDDVLSDLDFKTEAVIVERLFGPDGFFKKQSSTVLLITHTSRYFHLADYIIVLGDKGRVIQQGTLDALRNIPGYLSSLDLVPPRRFHERPASLRKFITPAATKMSFEGPIAFSWKTGDLSLYKYYIDSFGRRAFCMFLGSAMIFVCAATMPQLVLGWWMKDRESKDMASKDTASEDTASKDKYYIAAFFTLATVAFLTRTSTYILMFLRMCQRSGTTMHSILLKTAMSAPQSYHAETDSGMILARFGQDISLIDRDIPSSLTSVVLGAMTCLCQGAIIIFKQWHMFVPLVFLVIALGFIQNVYLRTSRQLRFMEIEARGPLNSHFLETMSGLSTIRAFGLEKSCREVNVKLLNRSQKPYYLLGCIQQWLVLVLNLGVAALATLFVSLPVCLGSLRKKSSDNSTGTVLVSVVYLAASLSTLLDSWCWLKTSFCAVYRLKTFAAEVVSENKPEETELPPKNWPNKGLIEMKNVFSSYGPKSPALCGVSLSIRSGQQVGICGRTGSGKTSLLLTLLRLLEMNSGSISIDGIDLQTVPRNIIRTSLIVIPQYPFILNDTVRFNADPSGKVPDEAIIEVLTKINIWQIIKDRGGLEAHMKLQPLSQGQQQLFCLARAMLKNPGRDAGILILDEATSNVDSGTDQMMQKIIREEFSGHTIITVAHRLNTVMDADMVVMLEGGRVVETGPPKELMNDRRSLFRGFYMGGSFDETGDE